MLFDKTKSILSKLWKVAKTVDRITGRYSTDVNDDWRQVESYLQQASYAVMSA
jgi:hypothetical protein